MLDTLLLAILEETPEQMQSLDSAIAAADVDTARRAAHTVLGNMRTVMAEQAMEQAAAVELLARDADFDSIGEPIETLRNTIKNVLAEITHHRESQ